MVVADCHPCANRFSSVVLPARIYARAAHRGAKVRLAHAIGMDLDNEMRRQMAAFERRYSKPDAQ